MSIFGILKDVLDDVMDNVAVTTFPKPTSIPSNKDHRYSKKLVSNKKNSDTKQKSRRIRNGDIIGVSRGHFDHYGIYVSGRNVIHYTSDGSDTSSSDNEIQETSFERFLRDSNKYFIIELDNVADGFGEFMDSTFMHSTFMHSTFIPDYTKHIKKSMPRKKFEGSEIVRRARSKIGEKKYSLLFNNCEHFAFWCAADIKDSSQISDYNSRFLASNRIDKKV